jgi:hypothetical protein
VFVAVPLEAPAACRAVRIRLQQSLIRCLQQHLALYAMTTESGTSCIIRWKMLAAVVGSLCTEQVTTVIKLFRSPSVSRISLVLFRSPPKDDPLTWQLEMVRDLCN